MAERGIKAGRMMAISLIGWLNMMYNKKTALRVLDSLVTELTYRRKDFK